MEATTYAEKMENLVDKEKSKTPVLAEKEPENEASKGSETNDDTIIVNTDVTKQDNKDVVKEEKPLKVFLHQYPRLKSMPTLSPFCLKLETFLRMYKIPYENHFSYKVGKKGKVPWIEYGDEKKADSNFIIEFLNQTLELNVDANLSDFQKALGRTVKVTLEENFYWTIIYDHYVANFAEFRNLCAPSGLVYSITMKMNQHKRENSLDIQGMGRHSKEEIYSIGQEDIKAVSVLLGEKPFLLGETPSSYDCTVFGFIGIVLLSGLDSPFVKYIHENANNLIKYCERMKTSYWPDWNENSLVEKPDTKKTFSIRKKNGKSKDEELEEGNETTQMSKSNNENSQVQVSVLKESNNAENNPMKA